MREIKFRAWLPAGHWAIERYGQMVEDYDGSNLFECLGFWSSNDGVKYLQYTGLKDKNGKEIYEGDIVRAYGNTVEVKYFVQQNGPYYAGYNMLTAIGTTHDVEIIGNIYENPKLI